MSNNCMSGVFLRDVNVKLRVTVIENNAAFYFGPDYVVDLVCQPNRRHMQNFEALEATKKLGFVFKGGLSEESIS